MFKYVVQRLLLMIPTVFLLTILIFTLLRVLMPQDAIDVLLGDYGRRDPAFRERLEEDLGLSGSLPTQYAEWVGIAWFWGGDTGILQADLGTSLHSGRPVLSELAKRIPVSLELGLWGQMTAILFAIPLGVWSALKQDRWPDYGLRSFAILINALPNFWIAVMIITFASIWFQWAPPLEFAYIYDDPIAHLEIMFLPALIIGLTPSGGLIRLTRTQMLEVLRQDYIRTAHAKGLAETVVLYRHGLRNALIPIVTVIGVSLPTVLSGTVIFEQIFTIPGMGRYLVDSIARLDYPVIQGIVLLFGLMLMFAVLIVDLSYAMLDPRIKYD
jgi:peptide/nickel transport system permease protein